MDIIKKWVFVTGLLVALLVPNLVTADDADECEYGKVESWVRFMDKDGNWGEWENTTVHANLKVHQPFQVKVTVYVKKDCEEMIVKLYHISNAYEAIEGPSKIKEDLVFKNVTAGQKHTFVWTVRPSGKWTDGISPLNIFCQFTKFLPRYDRFDYINVDYTVIAAYILPEEWEGNYNGEDSNTNNGKDIPAFEMTSIAAALILAYGLKSKK
ncbi:MAG: sarcinarray family MAST domain-containing protein [Thermoplasmata archaeon]|nr:sarcinarray family MAST domain-containing protein [Thermoplasmata archaeon]